MNIKIIVASHKPYWMPEQEMYLPLHVGHKDKKDIGYVGDDTGENISDRNARLCEDTGIYWMWKNLKADFYGLAHYRRYFSCHRGYIPSLEKRKQAILTQEQACDLLNKAQIVVPQKRKYYIETMESHFLHLPYTDAKDLAVMRKTIVQRTPEYSEAFEKVMHRTWAHMFNMFIMPQELFRQYCEWLFDILLAVDDQIDVSDRDYMKRRAVGYLSEFMLDVWVEKNQITYIECPVLFMEKQNWLVKGGTFLKRKFFGH